MGLPFKPRDWVQNSADQLAQVLRVYEDGSDILLDLVRYAPNGTKLGRVSPAMGGPRTFEPACTAAGWQRIKAPQFPMKLTRGEKGIVRYWGEPLPPADWTPPKRRARVRAISDDRFRQAIKKIADGHNDARQLAKDVLGGARP